MNIAVIGSQWGDEGKGKIVDYLSEKASYVIRFQGGNNAGHTVKIGDKSVALHNIPSGVCRGKKSVLGNGVVVNINALFNEINELEEQGFNIDGNLFISERAHIITQEHIELDKKQENTRKRKVGTTEKGIGPCYSNKIDRHGIRVIDFLEKPELIENYYFLAEKLKPYVKDTFELLYNAIENGENLIFEGAQGTFLDIDHGTYPYVTSSNTTIAGICSGTGIAPRYIDRVVGLLKAYTTRVGNGYFPTEQKNKVGETLLNVGKEFGTTTGRKRRCGWLDLFMANYSRKLNGIDYWVITKSDILSVFNEIKVCIGYKYNNELLTNYPSSRIVLKNIEPIYKVFKGWKTDISNCETFDDLPLEAKEYLKFIEDYTKTPIAIISVGAERNQSIILKDLWEK